MEQQKIQVGIKLDLSDLDRVIDNLKRAIEDLENVNIGITTDDQLTAGLNSGTPADKASWLTDVINKGSLTMNEVKGESNGK